MPEAASNAATHRIQRALKDAGYTPGPLDGIPGRLTVSAIKRFQAAHGLVADGIVGPRTEAELFRRDGDRPAAPDPLQGLPWMVAAERLLGTREVPGPRSNQVILDWAADLGGIGYGDDDIPWCGLFTAHCIGSQLAEEPLPNNPLGARNWQRFGVATRPQTGAVMVFWRGSKNGWQGHVGFYWAEDDMAYHVLGGNQSNCVSIARVDKDRLLEARWPKTAMAPCGATRIASRSGRLLSRDEA